MITELKGSGKAEFKKAITEFDRNPATTTVEALIGTLRTKVFTLKNLPDPQTEDQTAANKERQNQPVHYQATNLEHVDDEDPAKRRLEMRRFDAQRNLEDLVNNMVALSELVRECRLPGLVPVKF